jgi:hypothetical protein
MRSTLVGYSVPDVKSRGVAGPLARSCNSDRYDPCVLACHCEHIHGVYAEHIRFAQCRLRECVECKLREAIRHAVSLRGTFAALIVDSAETVSVSFLAEFTLNDVNVLGMTLRVRSFRPSAPRNGELRLVRC